MPADYAVPFVGKTGTCELAPEGTALPANANSSLDAAFVDLGEISEEGLEHAFDVSSEQIKNWSGKVLRSVNTETMATFKLQFMETNEHVLGLFYGQTVESQLGDVSRILITDPDTTPQAMVITVLDAEDSRFKRYVLPKVTVSERAELKETNADGSLYECTVMCLYDDGIGGYGYIQFDNDLTS